jgi:hypothetical protein
MLPIECPGAVTMRPQPEPRTAAAAARTHAHRGPVGRRCGSTLAGRRAAAPTAPTGPPRLRLHSTLRSASRTRRAWCNPAAAPCRPAVTTGRRTRRGHPSACTAACGAHRPHRAHLGPPPRSLRARAAVARGWCGPTRRPPSPAIPRARAEPRSCVTAGGSMPRRRSARANGPGSLLGPAPAVACLGLSLTHTRDED